MTPFAARVSAGRPSAERRPASTRGEAHRRPSLSVLVAPQRTRRTLSAKAVAVLSVVIIAGGLLAVVGADDLVVDNQIELSGLQSQTATQFARHQQLQLQIAQAEAPSRIVGQAEAKGMVSPGEVTDVPSVPLDVPLPEPKVASGTTGSPPGGTSQR